LFREFPLEGLYLIRERLWEVSPFNEAFKDALQLVSRTSPKGVKHSSCDGSVTKFT